MFCFAFYVLFFYSIFILSGHVNECVSVCEREKECGAGVEDGVHVIKRGTARTCCCFRVW